MLKALPLISSDLHFLFSEYQPWNNTSLMAFKFPGQSLVNYVTFNMSTKWAQHFWYKLTSFIMNKSLNNELFSVNIIYLTYFTYNFYQVKRKVLFPSFPKLYYSSNQLQIRKMREIEKRNGRGYSIVRIYYVSKVRIRK